MGITHKDRPLYCLRCAKQHPPDAKWCDCTPDGVELKSKNHPDIVKELCEKNMALSRFIANRYRAVLPKKWPSLSDIESKAAAGLLQAAMNYRFDQNIKFSSYASKAMWNVISHLAASKQRHSNVRGYDDIDESFTANLVSKKDEVDHGPDSNSEEVRQAIRELPSIEQYVVKQHYFLGRTLRQIANAIGEMTIDVFEVRERAVVSLRQKLSERLTLLNININLPWHSSYFGITVQPSEHGRFEEATRNVLSRIERYCVCLHFMEGKSITSTGKEIGIQHPENTKAVIAESIKKMRPFVNFESETERPEENNPVCSVCSVSRPMRTSKNRLCRKCSRTIKDQESAHDGSTN